jgi:3-hydroxybutyrate dehydrogenase
VTGAAGGIGRAVTEKLRSDGWDVLGVDVEDADLTTAAGNRAVVDMALDRFGRLDAVVANAGFQHVAPIREFPEERWDALAASDVGRFVAIASAHAQVASPFKAGYVSAKHGVLGLVRTLALEGADSGICATAVCPGFVRTPLVEGQVADQAAAHGVDEESVLEDVILAPHAVKRLI